MSIRALESAITSEARRHFNNRTLRVKDLQEWSTAPIEAQAGEVTAKLPLNGVYVAIKAEHDKRPTVTPATKRPNIPGEAPAAPADDRP